MPRHASIGSLLQGSTLTFFLGGPDRATKIINYQFLVARTGILVAPPKKKLEMNGGYIRLRMTLKINVGCLSLTSEMNDVTFGSV